MSDLAVQVAKNAEPKHVDSANNVLEVGTRIRVRDDFLVQKWDWDKEEYTSTRPLDFGEVAELNEDGTVEVYWDRAGCACDGSRTEKTEDLVVATTSEESIYDFARNQGYRDGTKEARDDFRAALGLPYDIEDLLKTVREANPGE